MSDRGTKAGTELRDLEVGGVKFQAKPVSENVRLAAMATLSRLRRITGEGSAGEVGEGIGRLFASLMTAHVPNLEQVSDVEDALLRDACTLEQVLDVLLGSTPTNRTERRATSRRRTAAARP